MQARVERNGMGLADQGSETATGEPTAAAAGREPESPALDLVASVTASARRRPDHLAVEAPDASLTYRELDRLSNQLAHRLIALGVGPESCVGISMARGAGELLAMLATAKAGGAYVPLDPSHPRERLRLILEEAAPQVMIVHSSSPLAGESRAGHLLILDDIRRATEGFPDTPPAVAHDAGQLAYVLFTSGSTGRPKGVEITRGAFANFLRSMALVPGLGENDRLLAVSTTTFDIAGLELFLPLAVGATVVIADRQTVVDPRRLRQRLETDDITVMQATPATWRLLLEAGWRGHGRLRMLCGGEAMSAALADRLLGCGAELWNMYGPTETTVWSSVERITTERERITIGAPIDCTQLYVLDENRRLVTAGTVGELFIGGRGLARGYRGRPDLTAERFVPNPIGPPGDLIYRTGDLARMLPDGRFECLGRIDHQVKIRGFRIELGEIESVLRQVPTVKEVLVVAEEREGDPRLVAYWVGGAGAAALIAHGRKHLPPYMLPSTYVNLVAFPLTPNGKIDRKALPTSENAPSDGSPTKRPRNDAETRMAALWREVLGVNDLGVDQDFFTLGGTSVTAVELRARIEADLQVELPLAAFFNSPTIEGLAALLTPGADAPSPDAPLVVDLRRGDSGQPPWFCLLGVQLYQELASLLPDQRTVIGMHVPFRYRPGIDRRPSLVEMATGYVELIRERQPHGPYHLAGLCFGGVVAFEAARQLEAAGETVDIVTIFDGLLPRALRVRHGRRLVDYLTTAVRKPRQVPTFLRKKAAVLASRMPWAQKLVTRSRPAVSGPIDVSIEGQEADDEIARYAALATPIASRLLVFRATAEVWASWLDVAPDLGWKDLSGRLIAEDVAATHLELLQQPHVEVVAKAMVAALPAAAAGGPLRTGASR